MNKIEATNTMEEINDIIGFESTIDAMIGSDPIWKFDFKNWISFKTYHDNVTIQATIDKESIKKGSLSYTWVDKTGQKLGAIFNTESGKCTIASYRR